MRLTKEKLLASWKVRKQLFSAPYNEFIINRFEAIQKLFHEIELFDVSLMKMEVALLMEKNYSS